MKDIDNTRHTMEYWLSWIGIVQEVVLILGYWRYNRTADIAV